MNKHILAKEVQDYINSNLNADVSKIALSKSPFAGVSSAELANQIAAKKKAEKKLPSWFKTDGIYYPSTLSVEQTSSEDTAAYKRQLVSGKTLVDLTAGFGVDSFYFSHKADNVLSCEINAELSEVSAHNAAKLGRQNIDFLAEDGLAYLENTENNFGTIYIDPARRSHSGKVFKLADCTPNVVAHLELLLRKANEALIKTSPLLDIQAGLTELKQVAEIHIVSVKNECKELLWLLRKDFNDQPIIICAALNQEKKQVVLPLTDDKEADFVTQPIKKGYLYEADAALMKSGAFNRIAEVYGLKKLAKQSHLYFAEVVKPEFMGRIFEIETLLAPNDLKKVNNLTGNVVVRNFPNSAEQLTKKYKVKANNETFFLFTQYLDKHVVFKTTIVQHY
jgi:16S rRNA G966 N2-methylase RsmD/LysM repeat protein